MGTHALCLSDSDSLEVHIQSLSDSEQSRNAALCRVTVTAKEHTSLCLCDSDLTGKHSQTRLGTYSTVFV